MQNHFLSALSLVRSSISPLRLGVYNTYPKPRATYYLGHVILGITCPNIPPSVVFTEACCYN